MPCPARLCRSDIVTPAALRNAMVVLQAIGGSTNGIIHLAAIAGRAGHPLDLAEFDRIGRQVPVLVDLKPSGEHYMEHFHTMLAACRGCSPSLPGLLDLSVPAVVGGGSLGDRP